MTGGETEGGQVPCVSGGSATGSFEGGIRSGGSSFLLSGCGGGGKNPALGGRYGGKPLGAYTVLPGNGASGGPGKSRGRK